MTMHKITKEGEVIQSLDVKLTFAYELLWNELTVLRCGTLDWAAKEAGVMKLEHNRHLNLGQSYQIFKLLLLKLKFWLPPQSFR